MTGAYCGGTGDCRLVWFIVVAGRGQGGRRWRSEVGCRDLAVWKGDGRHDETEMSSCDQT